MRIVTSGTPFMDIDGYACSIAYTELLQRKGEQAMAAISERLNTSVTPTVRSWPASFQTGYESGPDDVFTLVDVSEYRALDPMVAAARIDEVIDHHPGFEKYWRDTLGDRAHIEEIGAASTLIYEAWRDAGKLGIISETSARLLTCGILDNTLNFGAKLTTHRDHAAYSALAPYAQLPPGWPDRYFRECDEATLQNVQLAIADDTKPVSFGDRATPLTVGQLAVWDGAELLHMHLADIKRAMDDIAPVWFANIISLQERKSYLVCYDAEVKSWLEQLLGVRFTDAIAVASRPWLRKEMVKVSL